MRTTPTDDDARPIKPLRAPATYELVVDQLRRALALGRFVPGGKLPPERELSSQLGVSRTSVREAIRILEGEGVVEVRRGATGGVFVCEVPITQPTYEELREQATVYDEIVEFRLANECAAARLAASRRSDADAAGLEALLATLEANAAQIAATSDEDELTRLSTEFLRLDTQLHVAIARASGNRYLRDAVETGRIDMLRPVGGIFSQPFGDVNAHHRDIVEAIVARAPAAAESAMAEHIGDTRRQLEALVEAQRPARGRGRARRRTPGA